MPGEHEARRVVARLESEGWELRKGGKGSHRVYRKDGYPVVVVPMSKKELPIGTYRDIARKAGWL